MGYDGKEAEPGLPDAGPGLREALKDARKAVGPLLALAAVGLLFCFLAPAEFRSAYNLRTIVTQTVIVGIGAIGMTLVMIGGGIDLSVGSIIALVTVVVAGVLRYAAGFPPWAGPPLAIAAALAAGGLCGAFNGLLVARLRIIPFIVTLGTMQIARGLAKWLAREQTVVAPETWLNRLMDVDPAPAWLLFAPGVWLLLFLTAALLVMLRYTVFGRHVFAIGSSEQTARLCGIRVTAQRVRIYALCGAFTGLAGLMQFANLTVGDPTAANGMELDIIAAVVIGGGSLSGGEGGALGTLFGALLMAALRNGCNMIGIPNYVQNIVIGAVIIGAVAADRLRHR
ncbi:MAG: ABC transporter permease [Lentisphaerae bacterium]|nr:ABC transporter permease [Lentisphaerota bacterium]